MGGLDCKLRDCSDAVFETNEAAEYSSRVSDNSGQNTDHKQRAKEAQPSTPNVRRWDKGERYFPWEREHVSEIVKHTGRSCVAPIHRHRLLKLGFPVLFNHTDRVQVGVYHVGHFVGDVFQVCVGF